MENESLEEKLEEAISPDQLWEFLETCNDEEFEIIVRRILET